MAFLLLRLLVVAVIAAAADDVHNVTWSPSPRARLPCVVADGHRIQPRPPPPPLASDDKPRALDKQQTFIWTRDNVELSQKRIFTNGTLEVSRKQNNSEGVYQCKVWQNGGYVLGYPVNLKFTHIGKQFTQQPTNTTASIGQPVVFTCNISSGPSAMITWMKNEELLPDNISRRSLFLPNQLLITDVTEEDEGVYRCLATNPLLNKTRTSRPAWLRVENIRSPLAASFLPVHYESNIVVTRGSTIVLPCPVLGWPRPKINWLKGVQTMLESNTQVLVLRDIERRHEGKYKCIVEGTDLEKIFNIIVGEAVNITIPPTPKEVVRATTVRFNCTTTGHPKPTITWFRDGKPLLMGGRYNQRLSPKDNRVELVVGGVTSDDAGIYQCFASNAVSAASMWAALRVTGEGAPAPGAPRCWPVGARHVLVRWARPDVFSVVAYTVQTTDSAGTSSSPGQPHTNTKEEITVPKALTPYTFQVRAVIQTSSKRTIASDMSEGVICQGQGVPIYMSRPNDDKVLISWREFAEESPGVVQWILQYKASNNSREENITLDGVITSYTLDVPKSESILVRVLGSRSLEWLVQDLTLVPWSTTDNLDRGGMASVVPEALKATHIGTQEFTVTWRCESTVQVYGYRICVTNDDDFKRCVETDREWVTFMNLKPATEYEVTVKARAAGAAGELSTSLPLHVTTQPLVSGRFREVTCKFVNATALQVTWVAEGTHFSVSYTNKMYVPLEQWDNVDTTSNTVLINGIDRTTDTILKVTAYNPEESSNVVDCHAAKIKDLHYEFIPSGIRVSWNGTGVETVRYSQNLTLFVEQWASCNVTDNSVVLRNLDPSLQTYVMVKTPDTTQNSQVLTIPVRPLVKTNSSFYIGMGVAGGISGLCVLVVIAVCVWRRRKNTRSPHRPRRRNTSPNEGDEDETSEMKNMGGGLANGGGSKDAGEPLLNGHVHITENPQSKTPNGKMRKGRLYVDAFDLSRYDDQDTTLETVLDASTATAAYNLLDTSRSPHYDLSLSSRDLSANDSFNKLPDDNMNSELTRSTDFESDNSKIQPTLQPNG
ncbi:protogenin-like [Achroia grisella]|uniref:protogenin-like n=1 Tax=Achroia grisella TaxID=688607 RepID=UPI0027D345C7|nr:protogenin-like [Achroia grisella]